MAWEEPIFIATVVSQKGRCGAGHRVGDAFEINTHKTGGICGYCYHDLFPTLMTLAMGGKIPWWKDQNEFTYECPDKTNPVTFKIVKRKKG
ncbi:MAG: TIGR04076 family protein [Candidatus Bathyarchaeia archaeon]